ncbi:MAG: methyl-accepting chemotaxis protein, partial [Acidobacteriota bacterium]
GDIGRDDCLGLAYEASADAFYCAAGTTLLRLDAESAAAEAVGELDGFFRWLAPGPPGWLWGFDVEAQRVRAIELPRDWRREDGGSRRGGKRRGAQRRGEEGDDGAPSPPPAPPIELTPDVAAGGVRGLAAGSEGGGLWVAADRLLRLEDDGVEPLGLSGFRSEHSPIYRRYVGPIQRIREATGITYLYTQIPHDDPAYCVYILDGGAGEERIELGSVDPLPEESSLGQRQVLHRGEIYISDVVQWEQWGLLKVAFAPIFDRRGESSALAGADVNISIIEDKTRASLLRVLGTGALSLVLGLVLAVDIARRITGPVATVKEAALALAAGRFTEPVERSHLVELSRLSSALDDVGGTLEGTMSHLERSHGELEHRRCLREMADHLDRRIEEDSADAELEMIHRGDGARTTSGVAVGPAGTLAWFAPPAADLAEASRRRHDVHRIVRRQLERPTPGAAPLAEAPWSELFPDWIHGFVFRPRGRDRLEWCARRPLAVIGPDGARPALPTDLDGDGALDLAPRGWVVVGPPDGAGAGAAASAPPAGDPPELADWLGRDPGAPAGPYVIMTAAASPANPGPTAQGPSLP